MTITTERVGDLGALQEYFQDEERSGFAVAPMAAEAEEDPGFQELLKRLKITPRCIVDAAGENGAAPSADRTCAFTGARGAAEVVFRPRVLNRHRRWPTVHTA